MKAISFETPPRDDPEPGLPRRIEHGCDYDVFEQGKVDYYYNFIDYFWSIGGEDVQARTYIDRIQDVTVLLPAERLRTDPPLRPIVYFLQRRFRRIYSLHEQDRDADRAVLVFEYMHQSSR